MKLIIQVTSIFWLLITCLTSCNAVRPTPIERKLACNAAKTSEKSCFIELNDGTVKTYGSIIIKTGVAVKPHLLADGKERFEAHEVAAYQNKDHYAVWAGRFSIGGHNSRLALETLPGFAVRISSGKLNVYVKKYKKNNVVLDEYFLQSGDGQILPYSPELMEALIRNNPEALDFFNNNQRYVRLTKKLKTTAKIYNNTYFDELAMAKGKSKKAKNSMAN